MSHRHDMGNYRKVVCPLCGKSAGFWLERSARIIYRCLLCGHIFVPEGVKCDEMGKSIYESGTSIFESEEKSSYYLDYTSHLSAKLKYKILCHYVHRGAKVLDIGAGYGHFLNIIKDDFHAVGLELSPNAVQYCRNNFNVEIHLGGLPAIPDSIGTDFDAVTLWDVIEHLDDARSGLIEIHRHLKKNGHLLLSTPNATSLISKLLGRYWYHIDPVQHINLYSKKNISHLLESIDFHIIDVSTVGHYYRLKYIFNKLGSVWGKNAENEVRNAWLPEKLGNLILYLNPGDVMSIAARRIA